MATKLGSQLQWFEEQKRGIKSGTSLRSSDWRGYLHLPVDRAEITLLTAYSELDLACSCHPGVEWAQPTIRSKFTCHLRWTIMAKAPHPIRQKLHIPFWSTFASAFTSVMTSLTNQISFGIFVFLVDSQSSPFLFLWSRTQAKGYLQLSSYTSEPWRFNELFSTDTKVIVGTSQVGSGELQGKLQRTEADQLGESGEFIRLEKYHKQSDSDWHLLHTKRVTKFTFLSALSS